MDERRRVIEHSKHAGYADGIMQKATEYCGMLFKRYMKQGSVLEMGPAEGIMTDMLAPYFDDYTIVDGADFFVESIKDRHPKVIGFSQLFEEFAPTRKYDNIVLGHVLEHVENPVDILRRCSCWLQKEGVVLAAVPNSNSIHRQAAVLMGLLDSEKQLNEADRKNGHRRIYDIEMLKNDFVNAGFNIEKCGGYWLKPESNAQLEASWTGEMKDAFFQLGEKYPEISGEIYIVATI